MSSAARDPASSVASLVRSRVGALFATEPDDPRLSWLPERPDVLEAHLRSGTACDLVVGYSGERLAEFDGFMQRHLGYVHERGARDMRDLWATWLAAGDGPLDLGAQLAADPGRLQLYHRDRYSVDQTVRAYASVGIQVSERVLSNTLALLGLAHVEMLGLELESERVEPAVYVSVPNRGRSGIQAITDSVAFLLSATLPQTQAHRIWRAMAARLLYSPALEEWVYISFDPGETPRWVKVDVSQRPLALAETLVAELGTPDGGMVRAAEDSGFDPLAHLGIRFSARAPAFSIYASLL